MIKPWIRVFILIVLILVFLSIMFRRFYSSKDLIPVRIAEVKVGSVEQIVKMSGLVDSEDTELIVSGIEGIISNLRIKEGDWVRRGEVLCVVRNPDLRAKLLAMKAERVNAEENLKAAVTETDRQTALARYNFLRDNMADLEETMRYRAHINGDVIKVEVKNESMVAAGVKLIFLADMHHPVVKAHMEESDVQKVKVGQPAWITGDFLSGRTLQAKVLKIGKFVGREVGTYIETTCKILNLQNLPIQFGANANVRVVTARREKVLIIPIEALIGNGEKHVFVVRNDRAYLTPIKVGIIGERYVEVLSGLRAGDQVVTVGSLDLVDGSKIKILK